MAGGLVADLPLVDAHCHLLLAEPVDAAEFERCCTEADRPRPEGVSTWDTAAGLAIRRWCGPVLGLDPFPTPAAYLARRRELGVDEVTSRLLRASGLSDLLVDTGLPVQVHTGFGDRDVMLARADPALLQPWLAAVEPAGGPVVLLHCYP